MTSKPVRVTRISSVIVDDRQELSLEEVCMACHVDQTVVVEFVEEGIVEPRVINAHPWQFSAVMLPRLAQALRLQRDLELNTAGVAVALDLLDEIEGLRKQLNRISPQTEFD